MFKVNYLQVYKSQFIAVITASFGSISNGMEFSWSSPAVPILMSKETDMQITVDDSYWFETLYSLGGICIFPITAPILQLLGRKKSVLFAGSIAFICWILIATANTKIQLFVARFISGIGANFAFAGVPIYIAEITEPNVRGFFGSLVYVMNLVGVLISYSIVPYIPIYASAIVAAAISFLQLSTFCWQPESPYYLLTKSKTAQAKKMLRKLRYAKRDIDEEMELIAIAVERQNTEKGRAIDLILEAHNRKATFIAVFIQSAQNMLGITVIIMNVQIILENSGTVLTSQLSAVLFGVTLLISSTLGSILIDKFGRKFLLITSSLLSSLFLGILGGYFILQDLEKFDTSNYKLIPLFAVLGYAFVFKFGAGLVPIVIISELFPTSVKSMGMSVSCLLFTVSATVSVKIYYATVQIYGMYFPFLLFSLIGVLAAIVVYVFVPETKGKTLEEIQMILKGKK